MIPYAVVKTGGRQYRVSPGDSLSVEKLDGEPGEKLTLKDVLMIGGEKVILGQPTVAGASVQVVIEKQYRGDKVLVYKKKRRHKYRKMRGHRSELTRLFVAEITSPSGQFKAETEAQVWDAARIAEAKKARQAAPKKTEEGAEPVKKKAASIGAKKKTATKKKTGTKAKSGAKKSASKKKN